MISAYLDSASNRLFLSRVIIKIVLNFVFILKCSHKLHFPWPVKLSTENRTDYLIISLVLSVIRTLDKPQPDSDRKQYDYEGAAESILKYQS